MRVEIPMRLPSTANLRLHWAAKAKMAKKQRATTRLSLIGKMWSVPPWRTTGGLDVTLTRVSPRALDDDNLATAFKHVRDEAAKWLGVNDNDPRVSWKYAQAKGKAAVVIEIFSNPAGLSEWETP